MDSWWWRMDILVSISAMQLSPKMSGGGGGDVPMVWTFGGLGPSERAGERERDGARAWTTCPSVSLPVSRPLVLSARLVKCFFPRSSSSSAAAAEKVDEMMMQ